jgi:carbon-monoxide dehydrogenase medium subunit
MKPPVFERARPNTTSEALALLDRHGLDAKILAGGQSLVPLLNFRLAKPQVLIDINGLEGLDTIAEDTATGEIAIGALVRQTDAERSPVLRSRCPLLAFALQHVGHRTIRNRGTVGGSLAHADPAAELPLILVALDGRVKLKSIRGERWVSASEFFVSFLTTALEPNELLVEVRYPVIDERTGWGFEEFSRRGGDFALVAVCATLRLKGKVVDRAAIAVAGGGAVPLRLSVAEDALAGREATDEAIGAAAALAASACTFDSDIHASADYRRDITEQLVKRALAAALRGRPA